MQLTEDRIQISAAGIFNVGMHLIPSVRPCNENGKLISVIECYF